MGKHSANLVHETKTVALPVTTATTIDVEIAVMDSDLRVTGGASDLLEATFTYNPDQREAPKVEFTDNRLIVRELYAKKSHCAGETGAT